MVKSNEIVLITVAALCFAVGAVLFAPAAGVAAAAAAAAAVGDEESIGPATDEDYSAISAEPPYPDSDNLTDPELPPEPSPGYYKFLEECAKKINPECSKEIFAGMLADVTLSKPCCTQLVDMGRECHYGLVKIVLAFPEFKPNASKFLLKSEQIWNECDSAAGSAPPF